MYHLRLHHRQLLQSVMVCACTGIFLSSVASGQSNLGDLLKRHELITRFDKNGDGRLNVAERTAAQQWIHQEREGSAGGRRLLRHSRIGSRSSRTPSVDKPAEVSSHKGKPWFDPDIMRTVSLSMPGSNWHGELSEFYRTDVEVPGTLTIDGQDYPGVGVRYRGSSSYIMVSTLKKKSFNISLDYTDDKARIDGNRTVNFLNCNQDPSLIRDAIFAQIAGQFVPTPRVNFIKLIINGANWGVYGNAQQFNKDFLKDWFGNRKSIRWKIERNYGGVGALRYLGDDQAAYQRAFQLKTKNAPGAWSRLIRFCKVLNEPSLKRRELELPALLDIDRTLWFLALEWVFQDSDGYVKQGYDYRLVENPDGRFLPVLYDNNEILPLPNLNRRAVNRQGQQEFGADPLEQRGNSYRPLISCLLAVPEWRARYLAHVRTIATECLDWKQVGSMCQKFHDLIDAEVRVDRRRLTTVTAFESSIKQLESLFAMRRQQVLGHSSLAGPWPKIETLHSEVVAGKEGAKGACLRIDAVVSGDVPISKAFLYFRALPNAAFQRVSMVTKGTSHFVGVTPEVPLGSKLDYYVEVRASKDLNVSAFYPAGAEAQPAHRVISK